MLSFNECLTLVPYFSFFYCILYLIPFWFSNENDDNINNVQYDGQSINVRVNETRHEVSFNVKQCML